MEKKATKITRNGLRAMKDGESVTVTCKDGYDLDTQKNTAYQMQKMEMCRFSCRVKGLILTVTRHG